MTNKDNGGPASDRELLEMAAKAAGVVIDHWRSGYTPVVVELFRGHLENYNPWNPLTDGADALRLAVNLRITVAMHADAVAAMHTYSGRSWCESYDGDKHAATRRAIVRAAAAIGSAM